MTAESARSAALAAADGGIDFECLSIAATQDGYDVAVPGVETTVDGKDELAAFVDRHGRYVEEWHFWTQVAPDVDHRRAFLRWLEDADDRSVDERRDRLADGLARTWGQLRIAVRDAEDGRRGYEVRHEDDAGRPVADLEERADAEDVRSIARTDDRGRYRPLATAPTLPRGWLFPDLDADAVVRVVDAFYPATIANWHRERTGTLDVTHWREAADRQTGIYEPVADLSGEQLAWLTEACCVDSQCCKRREWDESEDEPIDVPRGTGEFPCREPCSLAIAAARTAALRAREPEEVVDLELTPGERSDLCELLDAVAEGRVDEVRAGDVDHGANAYRARYLRAKLSGDATGSDAE